MLAITDYPAFVIAILVFLAIPGPGNLAMISSTAQGGIRGGLASTFGIIAGDQILLWCAVAGVAAGVAVHGVASMVRHAGSKNTKNSSDTDSNN